MKGEGRILALTNVQISSKEQITTITIKRPKQVNSLNWDAIPELK